jgi:mannobiose 2-epimerase
LFFTPQWQALPDHDSFGHDVETAFLLVEAAAALGRPEDARTWALARRIVDHALQFGWDTRHGGFYDAGGVFGPIFNREKIWWVQAEGMNALLLMDGKFGGETSRYWEAFIGQWQFIQRHQIDARHGGWFSEVSENGEALPGRVKSDGWTEGYHQGRALLTVSAALRARAADNAGHPLG